MSTQPGSITPTIPPLSEFEKIDSAEFAKRISMTESWVRNQTRSNCDDPIPHVKLGRYVRFEWNSPELNAWWDRHRKGNSAPLSSRPAETERRLVVCTVLRRGSGRETGDSDRKRDGKSSHVLRSTPSNETSCQFSRVSCRRLTTVSWVLLDQIQSFAST